LAAANSQVIDTVGLTPRVSAAPRPSVAAPFSNRREVNADIAVSPFQLLSAPVDNPAPAAAPPPVRLATQPPQVAHDVGLAIARQLAAEGNSLFIRLEPAELGRIDVRMSFDERGTLRAVLGADSALSLDLLRRDTADLGRALTDAGVRADSQSFRFESRSDGRGGDTGQQRPAPPRFAAADPAPLSETPDPTRFRPLRWRGQVDVLA